MKKQIISQLVLAYTKTLNPKSKWLKQDIADYKENVSKLPIAELKEKLGKLNAMNDKNSEFNTQVKNEMGKMDKAGMFDVRKMKPENCLN